MKPSWRSRRVRVGVLAATALLAGGWGALAHPFRPAPPSGSGALSDGASSALVLVRREQALIRAEGTAAMLRALRTAPTLPGGNP